jgi:hypothetical protein
MLSTYLAALDDEYMLVLVGVLSIHLVIKGWFRFAWSQTSSLLMQIIIEASKRITAIP